MFALLRTTHATLPAFLFALLMTAMTPVHADSLAPLLRAGKVADIEAQAQARVSRNAVDDLAWWYLAKVSADTPAKREALLPKLEQCTKQLPASALCQHAIGTLYVGMVEESGIAGGLKYASHIKNAFLKAVELDPKHFEMRRDLIQFYLQAPGLVGGSVSRAVAQADAYRAIDAYRGAILRAEIHLSEKEWEHAERLLTSLNPAADAEGAETLGAAETMLGFGLINSKDIARAERAFRRSITAAPTLAIAHMGLGRALLEQKQLDAAIASLERAAALDARVGAHYRLGIAYEQKGDRSRAIAAFEQFLSYRTSGQGVDEAKKRLASLRQG